MSTLKSGKEGETKKESGIRGEREKKKEKVGMRKRGRGKKRGREKA